MGQWSETKLFALITFCGMLLGSYLFTVLRRRVSLLLEGWGREAAGTATVPGSAR